MEPSDDSLEVSPTLAKPSSTSGANASKAPQYKFDNRGLEILSKCSLTTQYKSYTEWRCAQIFNFWL